jgi:hypothetical protein
MNHKLWSDAGARVLAAMFVVAGLSACGERLSDVSARTPKATPPDSSAVVIGTAPAQPSGDPPGTTPVAPNTSDVSKADEVSAKPAEGDNHSHSSLAAENPQKADGKDAQQIPPRGTQ